jgi:hypothetical protein
MKLGIGAILACFVCAVVFSAEPAEATGVEKQIGKSAAVGSGSGVAELGQPPNVPPTTKPVKPPKPPKPPRSNKNDGDDGSDDGNAGGGNDDKPPKDETTEE